MEKIQRRLKNLCLNPNWRILCKKSNATDHIFLHCPYTKNIWNMAKSQLNWNHIDENLSALVNIICSNNIKTQRGVIIFNLLVAFGWKETTGYSTTYHTHTPTFGRTFAILQLNGLPKISSSRITPLL